jgi:hypothetical protein
MEIALADDLVRFILVYHQFDHGEGTPKNMCFGVEVVLTQHVQPDVTMILVIKNSLLITIVLPLSLRTRPHKPSGA